MMMLSLIGLILWLNYNQLKEYDNTTHYSELISKRYSEEEIAVLEERVKKAWSSPEWEYTFFSFCLDFKVECVRKALNQYYVVLLQEDGKRVFVYFNKDWKASGQIVIVDKFKSKEEFDSFVQLDMPMEKIQAFDSNTLYSGRSSFFITGHYVKEGAIVLRYFNDIEKKERRVDAIEFLPNGEETCMTESFWMPCILAIDRIDG